MTSYIGFLLWRFFSLCSFSLAHTSVMSFWVRLNFYFHLRFICKHIFFYTQMLYVNQSRVYCSTRMWVRVWVQKVAELIKRFFFLCDVLFRRVFVFILFSVCHIKIYGMLFLLFECVSFFVAPLSYSIALFHWRKRFRTYLSLIVICFGDLNCTNFFYSRSHVYWSGPISAKNQIIREIFIISWNWCIYNTLPMMTEKVIASI